MPRRPAESASQTKIKKNDQVKVIAGRDQGKTGRVISVDRKARQADCRRRVDD